MRLISFLGTGNKDGKYDQTTYTFDSQQVDTQYVAYALATMFKPKEIKLIATKEAWEAHGNTICSLLTQEGHPAPERVHVQTGGAPQQLWEMFGSIVDAISTCEDSVLLDITHGFRMQPFFAAACIQYVQSVLKNPPEIRVFYGEFGGKGQNSPIWELTPFLEVLSWSRSLMMFLRTGQADGVVTPTYDLGNKLNRERAMSGQKDKMSQLKYLASAIKSFSDDYTTIRTGSLLSDEESSAQKLQTAIEKTLNEVEQELPPLVQILDQVSEMVEPLRTNGARLSSTSGQRALVNLAKLYQRMGRYSEACSVIREGWITLGAPENADHPGETFDKDSRKNQEIIWKSKTTEFDSVSELRNDIQHAGFKKQPKKREWFEREITTLLAKWEAAIDASEGGSPEDVSNHVKLSQS
jgi:CRISPR-associated protein Csx16